MGKTLFFTWGNILSLFQPNKRINKMYRKSTLRNFIISQYLKNHKVIDVPYIVQL